MSAKKQPPNDVAIRRVALMVESSSSSGRQVLRGVAEYVRQTGPWSLYYEPSHILNTLPDWMEQWQSDGVIARIRNRETAKRFAKMGIPVVDILGVVPNTGIPLVQVDNQHIAELAANYLLGQNLHSFGFCDIRGHAWARQRHEEFRNTIVQAGFECHVHQLPSFEGKAWYSEPARNSLDCWIAQLPKPVGIMAANDWAGQKVLDACRRVGALVPEEVAVIGVDNDEAICEVSEPMLTSIVAQHDRTGFYAAELLDRLMRGKRPPSNPVTVGTPSIVVRRSTTVETISDRDMIAAVRYIRENACNGIRVEDVADHVSLSYSTLKRRFDRFLSRSIHDEIQRVRIERVRELLKETDMTLAEIARTTGFRHQEYLGAVFKSHTGTTPGQFREEEKRSYCYSG
jgi:LacI family transcriptional regulator